MSMIMKPQDILVALYLCLERAGLSYADKAACLGMSASEVHAAERRLSEARLFDLATKTVKRDALYRFLVHGVPFAFAVSPKEVTRGIPTAWAAPALSEPFVVSEELPPVWPDPHGECQGVAVKPFYRSVSTVAQNNSELYELLALADALRIGRARERKVAERKLEEILKHHAAA